MKQLLYTILFTLFTLQLVAQVQAVCDEAVELPDEFTLDFFVIYDNNISSGPTIVQSQQYTLNIFADSIGGESLYQKTSGYIPNSTSGFISFDIRSSNNLRADYYRLLDYINSNPTKDYWAELTTTGNRVMGTKQLYAVPYAQVANVLGGLGERGPAGANGEQGWPGPAGVSSSTGATGAQGFQGPPGEPGTFDFENNLLIMTDEEPTSGTFYVDDGTNTEDGKPHLRYNLNGTWIDL